MAREYVEIVDAVLNGQYDDLRAIDSHRLVLHEQILRYTGLTRATDMYRWCKNEMHLARLAGYIAGQDY